MKNLQRSIQKYWFILFFFVFDGAYLLPAEEIIAVTV